MKSAFYLEQSGTKLNGKLFYMLRYTCVPKIGSFGCMDQCIWSVVPLNVLEGMNLLLVSTRLVFSGDQSKIPLFCPKFHIFGVN